jgi:Glycine-rich domain-containing protein-like
MQTNIIVGTPEQSIAAAQAIDLEPIRRRIMDAERGEGWTMERAVSVERAYRAYLAMLVKHPDAMESIVVSKDVDAFWHTHILHTMKYTADCQRVFGAYLHHNPQNEARSAADIERTRRLAAETGEKAMCSAAVETGRAAMCSAAIQAGEPAMCSAAVQVAAMCSAAVHANPAV